MTTIKRLRDQFEEHRAKKSFHEMSKDSINWFYKHARDLSTNFSKARGLGQEVSRPVPGKFYLYQYDPKTKDRLPVYDTMPLVLITEITEQGWYGINFHYMPPKVRLAIMEALYSTIEGKKPERVKLRMNYDIARRVAQTVGANDALSGSIKQYLSSHLRSPLMELKPEHWAMAVFLPLARFKRGGTFKR